MKGQNNIMHNYNINDDIEYVMITADKIQKIVKDVAKRIDNDYPDPDSKLLLLCILKGSICFTGDLMKYIHRPVEIDFMKVSSYGSETFSSGNVTILLDLNRHDINNIDIVVVEDIIDSGNTMSFLTGYLKHKGARSVKVASLLDKPSRRVVDFTPDYTGMVIDDKFVVGYGLDYNEKYRALPYVGVLKPEIYSE